MVSAVATFGLISPNASLRGRAVLKTPMSASCAAGIIYLLETNTDTSSASEFCVITEQYSDLVSYGFLELLYCYL